VSTPFTIRIIFEDSKPTMCISFSISSVSAIYASAQWLKNEQHLAPPPSAHEPPLYRRNRHYTKLYNNGLVQQPPTTQAAIAGRKCQVGMQYIERIGVQESIKGGTHNECHGSNSGGSKFPVSEILQNPPIFHKQVTLPPPRDNTKPEYSEMLSNAARRSA